MTTITTQPDTTEGAVTTPESAATTGFEVDAAETRQLDPAADTAAVAPQLPSQPQAASQPQMQSEPQQGPAFAITSFVLGLASIVSGWMLFAPVVGLILGILALRRGTPERALALWGVWLNGVMLALSLIGVAVFGALLGAGIFVLPIFTA